MLKFSYYIVPDYLCNFCCSEQPRSVFLIAKHYKKKLNFYLKPYSLKQMIWLLSSFDIRVKTKRKFINPQNVQRLTTVLYSLSFHPICNHSKLTIFNSFNFMAHEFFVKGNLLEIFRVFKG